MKRLLMGCGEPLRSLIVPSSEPLSEQSDGTSHQTGRPAVTRRRSSLTLPWRRRRDGH
ncbi:hypothetical protein [Thiobaca trueperi]|uniref:hypothetical protein n=1 Tax=Thiobaca trueperi TaxID=127458 RepID=UPI001404FFAE|nr:hypothetical protein [Thiobaca trueperi]